jgi:NAD(P)-dependent dehydrogenase (short-subunit alcohol dehydrogenase family)
MSDTRPVALITGAGTGIGLATALLLARAGHRIAMVGRRESVLRDAGATLGEEGPDWAALGADVADPAQALALPSRVVSQFGRLDALVNNAGWTPLKPVADHTPEDVAQIFAVNTIGPVLLLIGCLRVMQDGEGGRIVNVSSRASADPFPGLCVYGGAKAALNTLTKGLANELGAQSAVRVFCVAPGAVETPLLRSIIPESALPREACLAPEDVGAVIADCVLGRRDAESGSTIWVNSP